MSQIDITYKSVRLTVYFQFFAGHRELFDNGGLICEPSETDSIEIESIETIHGDDITTLFDTTANEIEKLVFEKLEQIREDDR